MLRPTRLFDGGKIIPQSELDEQIGSTLADFCRGFPTVRLYEIPAGSTADRERTLFQLDLFHYETLDHQYSSF